MIVRDAKEQDFTEITRIYNEILLSSMAIFSDQPSKVAERIEWSRSRAELGYPTLVACSEDEVIGYASFGNFRSGPGYRFSVEHTVHVDAASRGHGVGRALMNELTARAAVLGKHVMVGGIDAENSASLQFHERLGFERVAYLKEVGFKFGRFLDLVLVQLDLSQRLKGIHSNQ